MEKNKSLEIFNKITEMFPDARCELIYKNAYELLIATILSAQSTDISVNKVTKILFERYPSPYELSKAEKTEVMEIIKSIGLYRNKANNIIKLASELIEKYDGEVPNDFDKLTSLPGIGTKTANVVLSEYFNIPRIAVDTHVLRVSKCLGFTKSNDPKQVEEDLMALFPQEFWHKVHLELLFFGRYFCKAKNPLCDKCFYKEKCQKYFS